MQTTLNGISGEVLQQRITGYIPMPWKKKLIPWADTPQKSDVYIYAEEADLINLALFGLTAKQWKEKFPEKARRYKTIRDCADTRRLIVLSNLESLNAVLIRKDFGKKERFDILRETAISQLKSLSGSLTGFPSIESSGKTWKSQANIPAS